MTARRPLLTAAAAGSVLLALWFVPSANAIVGDDGTAPSGLHTASAATRPGQADLSRAGRSGAPGKQAGHPGRAAEGAQSADSRSTTTHPGGTAPDGGRPHRLADTGSPDTTPYVVGGAACLALGAALVGYSVRRTRDEAV
ncbi:hypothetical protein GCM10010211_50170 [Streptomyces albospinus]|uniref:Gram-positive cocci surface proteins LPxTG domain-containing protein n=1 Tax=Streptomyces albospinus TaxID=285515 RepID=A0ABQ2VDW5_9ACTN|nr:hypothetical protein [Streptomyces albospinus]GGU78181.1 hypothetical protein GCM10010211_50170 [Streptomyces albospinus]